MASQQQNKAFTEALLPQYPLDEAVDFIQSNLDPADVFTDKQLCDWAESNGYKKEE